MTEPRQPSDSPTGSESRRRELRETKANLFSTVLDAMTDGVMVVDDKLRVVVTNRALRETVLLGPGSHGHALERAIAEPRLHVAFRAVLQGAGPQTVAVEHHGLQDRLFDVLVVPLPDHEYWGHRALGVFRDVTEVRTAERMLRDFIANASHELRTPATALLGYAETLVDAPPKDVSVLRKFHATIYRHAQRLSTLLSQLLDLNRLDAQTWHLNPESLDLPVVLAGVVEQQAEVAVQAGLSVHLAVEPALRAWADRGAIEIIVGNLVQNAIKYTPPGGGRVEVRARAERDGGVRLSVLDSGIGISDADQHRVFERFYRVDKGRSRRMGGVGLGLSIVQGLVAQMGGRLELSSRVGKGTTFSVVLP